MGGLVGPVLGAVGGIIGGNKAAKAQRAAADAQAAAAKQAAEEARFRPIGVTNAFGSSNFQFDPSTGRLSGASYEVNPQLAALRDQLLGFAGGSNVGAAQQALQQGQQSLFGTVAGAGDITGQTQRLFQQRQSLLAPQRERDLANLRNQSFQAGRSGLAVGGTEAGGFAAANPEMQAFYNAQRQADQALLAQSEADARNYRTSDLQTLGGLFGLQQQSLSPLMAYLQGGQGIENLGKSAFDTSMELGRAQQNPTGANALYQGGMASAQTRLGAQNTQNAGLSNLFGVGANLLGSYFGGKVPPPVTSFMGGTNFGGGSSLFGMGGPG